MKKAVVLFIVTMLMTIPAGETFGSWLIDDRQYHVSVHGELSCLDCHSEMGESRHPDPRMVNRIDSGISSEKCADCHPSAEDYLAGGEHGGKIFTSLKQAGACLHCHNPHYDVKIDSFDSNKPAVEQCGACHEAKSELPKPDQSVTGCYGCHVESKKNPTAARGFCLSCHDSSDRGGAPYITGKYLSESRHGELSCLECHARAAAYGHDKQPNVECLACHSRHGASTANDAHLGVSCQACHIEIASPVRDAAIGVIHWRSPPAGNKPFQVHALSTTSGDDFCGRCHFPGNELGVSSKALPPKGVLCAPCHASVMSAGDSVSLIALSIFFLGVIWMLSIWRVEGRSTRMVKKKNTGSHAGPTVLLKTLLFDVLLQRRLRLQSQGRWLIHALIFHGMLLRFIWGLAASIGTAFLPDSHPAWELIDKNNPGTAVFLDLTGLMILAGVSAAVMRRLAERKNGAVPGLPPADWPSLMLLGGCVLAGFVLEGARIAMTGSPFASGASFVGNGFSLLFSAGRGLNSLYPWLWYIHAGLFGAFVAWLPFGRMPHMVLAPLTLLSGDERKH